MGVAPAIFYTHLSSRFFYISLSFFGGPEKGPGVACWLEAVFKFRSQLDQGCLPEIHKDFGGQLFDLVLVVAGRDLLQLSVRQWFFQTDGNWGDIVALALNSVAPL